MRKEPDPKGRTLGDSTEGQDPCHLMGTELQIEEKVLELETSACNSYQDKGQEVPTSLDSCLSALIPASCHRVSQETAGNGSSTWAPDTHLCTALGAGFSLA